jgi:hypothetical protein
LVPAVSLFAGANFTMERKRILFSNQHIISKIILITQNHLGDGMGFVTNIIADYVVPIFPSYGYVLTLCII